MTTSIDYLKQRTQALDHISALHALLETHADKQAKSDVPEAFVADLERLNVVLREAVLGLAWIP